MPEHKNDTVYLEQWKFQNYSLYQVKMNQVRFKKEKFKKKNLSYLPLPHNLPTEDEFNGSF